MRTTVDLPDELMRAAKARAAEQGASLKDWFARVVSAQLARPLTEAGRRRVRLPLIESKRPGTVRLTNADLAEIEAAEDVEHYRRGLRRR